jgi:hypothetical protein
MNRKPRGLAGSRILKDCDWCAAAVFSRVRNADLGRFTADRLMAILNRLGARVEVKVWARSGNALGPIRG